MGYWTARRLKDANSSKPSSSSNKSKNWWWIWRLNIMPKVKTFLWRCMQDSLPTRINLLKRGIDIVHLCPNCGFEEETLEHTLRDCGWSVFF